MMLVRAYVFLRCWFLMKNPLTLGKTTHWTQKLPLDHQGKFWS